MEPVPYFAGYAFIENELLIERWFALTRKTMPAIAAERDWPVRLDHCFQRILLDNAVGAKWRDVIAAPAYRNATAQQIERALEIGDAVLAGGADLQELNRNSLRWRGKLRA